MKFTHLRDVADKMPQAEDMTPNEFEDFYDRLKALDNSELYDFYGISVRYDSVTGDYYYEITYD